MPSTKIETNIWGIFKKKKIYRNEVANNFPFKPKNGTPIIGIWYNDGKDKNMAAGLIDGLKSIGIPVVLITKTDGAVPFDFREKCATVSTHDANYRMFYEACDMMIMMNDAVDENFLYDLWQNGIIPIAIEGIDAISNYNPNNETGNAFTYASKNIWEIFAAVVRGIETYKFPYDWKHIIRQGLKSL
ncbi:hypothetical protein HZA39_00110 [Candidatus Peregrinibacteria bacterium]|nr:hypothetical protein [Candidatus Peregrinibacteria bacterium]